LSDTTGLLSLDTVIFGLSLPISIPRIRKRNTHTKH